MQNSSFDSNVQEVDVSNLESGEWAVFGKLSGYMIITEAKDTMGESEASLLKKLDRRFDNVVKATRSGKAFPDEIFPTTSIRRLNLEDDDELEAFAKRLLLRVQWKSKYSITYTYETLWRLVELGEAARIGSLVKRLYVRAAAAFVADWRGLVNTIEEIIDDNEIVDK